LSVRYVARKLGFYAIAAWSALTLNFLLPQLIPGDPVQALLGRENQSGAVSQAQVDNLRELLGLGGGSFFDRYWRYLDQLAHFDLGRSVTYFPANVTAVIGQALPWTIALVGIATILSFTLGIALGTVSGWRRGTWIDNLVPSTTFLTAIPYFWLALLLLYLFSQVWPVLPLNGGYDPDTDVAWSWSFLGTALQHGILPAATIVISSVGGWLLGMRNMMVTTLSDDYVVAAEAKGLSPRTLMIGYAARNAVLPSVAGFAISLGFVVSGSIVMEVVFSYPGIGYTLLQGVQNDDYPLMQGVFLVITMAVLGANLLIDLLYGFVDPRTRQSR
jgi:peptide/nickel transport system permease protein